MHRTQGGNGTLCHHCVFGKFLNDNLCGRHTRGKWSAYSPRYRADEFETECERVRGANCLRSSQAGRLEFTSSASNLCGRVWELGGLPVVPFVVESHGAVSAPARAYLDRLAQVSSHDGLSGVVPFSKWAADLVAISIQRGHAIAINVALSSIPAR